MRRAWEFMALAALTGALASCASLTVTQVTPTNDATVKGVRYFLPKPFIVIAPQADGTVSATVVYLPDKDREYAIESNSTLSSYAFQASTDPEGLLTGVQYNTNTATLPAQAAASTGAGIAAALNYQAAEATAIQTQVNTAQAGVVAAQSAYSAAVAALTSDQEANAATPGTVSAASIQADESLVAQKQAALQVAQAALKSTQSTPQAIAGTAAAGTPVAATAAAPGTAFAAPQWSQGPSLNLPARYGPVWFAVDDTVDANAAETVALTAATSAFPKSIADSDRPQPIFQTTLAALGPPRIPIPSTPFSLASKLPAIFMFSRTVTVSRVDVFAANAQLTPEPQSKPSWDHDRTITVDISKLKPGAYWLNVTYEYQIDPAGKLPKPSASQKFIFDVVTK